MHTFLWHDYETFGTNTRRDRPAQFAAIRTDAELNEIGEPVMIYCRPANDYLPDPVSCLITGITPQLCLEKGLPESEFAARIEAEMARPGTIGVGYNTIRFDDEITRYMFWRNLIDPYAREWQNQCGRWDLLDVVRMTRALRPEGIEWPLNEEGQVSFRLEHLTRANGLVHEAAHDALSDVRATIALARLIRQHQPKLFDYALSLHKKDRVIAELRLPASIDQARPFLHVSGMFPADRGCLAVMFPLTSHPTNKNEVLAWDLSHDPCELVDLDVETIRLRMFSKAAELPEGMTRLPIKTIHLNKSPMIVGNVHTLSAQMAERWGLDLEAAAQNAQRARELPDMSAIWAQVFKRPAAEPLDVDQDLYGGFVGNEDRRRLHHLRSLSPEDLATARTGFDDPRLAELFWRYRARNFPATLSPEDQERWEMHRQEVLMEGVSGSRTFDMLFAQLDELGGEADERASALLEAVYDYAESISPDLS
ncbi:exodeoxyribonuclease I [Diaphorobacter ruginosibacter]|uniref:Exodeoxyribonuclease I n=1 Tax=Diaphorobacter ruginosibacter TaxID=1715720 RepID=A0A7G9RU87_9BURK|nr:exodeoxyribonuclease I [Diaphorobacter ruginosibacter]QNN59162.1 exodeoxyribonuclease I [Diaphorobacter ruginosibacter]